MRQRTLWAFGASVAILWAQSVNVGPQGGGLPGALYIIKGATYILGRVALIDGTGAISSVAGSASDCVHVDGSSGTCGSGGGGSTPTFTDGETPGGATNGSNLTFTLNNIPSPASSVSLYRNGLFQKQGYDYTITSSTLTFSSASVPQNGDVLVANYRR